jgi:hypothetical protein
VAYTSDDLITDIDRDSFQPAAQDHFTTAQKLLIADQAIHKTLAPLLVSLDSGYFLETADASLVADQQAYDLDRYAMWGKLRKLRIVETSGRLRMLDLLTDEQTDDYPTESGTPVAFSMQDKQILLYPPPSDATETLRQWIYRRPGRLVATTAAAVVSSVANGVVTYTGAPPATHTSSSVHDFYSGRSPFRRIATAATATGQAGSTQTFATATAALLTAGDYVCLRDETVFPAVPIELSPFLSELVILSLNKTQMDAKAYELSRQEIGDRARAAFMAGPGQRVVGHPKKISIPLSRIGRRGPRVVSS